MSLQYFTVGDPICFHGKTGEIDYYDNSIAVIKLIDGSAFSISHVALPTEMGR